MLGFRTRNLKTTRISILIAKIPNNESSNFSAHVCTFALPYSYVQVLYTSVEFISLKSVRVKY